MPYAAHDIEIRLLSSWDSDNACCWLFAVNLSTSLACFALCLVGHSRRSRTALPANKGDDLCQTWPGISDVHAVNIKPTSHGTLQVQLLHVVQAAITTDPSTKVSD